LATVVNKFAFFDGTENSLRQLQQFHTIFETLQKHLQEICPSRQEGNDEAEVMETLNKQAQDAFTPIAELEEEQKIARAKRLQSLSTWLDLRYRLNLPVQLPVPGIVSGYKEFAAWFPYRTFSLLYRATIHGFRASDFHSACDPHPCTITIIETTTGHLFGGYRSEAWRINSQTDSSARFFILRRSCGVDPRLYIAKPYTTNVCTDQNFGPCFGNSWLRITDKSNEGATSTCSGLYCNSFTGLTGEMDLLNVLVKGDDDFFRVKEIEVYHVT